MTLLDMRTIIFSHAVIDIVCTLVILLLWHQSRKRFAGTAFWVSDFAFQTAALFLIILRGSIPDWMSMVFSNILIVWGSILGYMGLGRFVGKKISQVHNYALLAAFACVHIYFTLVQPNLAARTLNLSTGLLIICFQCMWLLVHKVDSGTRRLTLGVGMVFGGYCLVSVVRIVEFFTGMPISYDFFHSGTFGSLVLISYQVLLVLFTYSLVLMVNKRLLVEVNTQEEKFAKAFHSSPNAIMLTQLSDGKIFEVNDGFLNIAGYQYAEAIGKTSGDLHLWDKEEDREGVVGELSKGGKVRGREFRFRKKSGELMTGLYSAEIIPINNQKYVLSSIADITDRKRAEEALRESEERFRILADATFEGIAITEHGRIVDANEQLAQIVGDTQSELIGQEVALLVAPEDRDRVMSSILAGSESHTEHRMFRRDGAPISVETHGRTIAHQGRQIRITAIRDITERKRTEETLRRYELLAGHSRDIFLFIRRDDGRILEANAAAVNAYGYDHEELLTLSIRDLRAPETVELTETQMSEADAHGILFETVHRRKDGSTFPVEVSSLGATFNGKRMLLSVIRNIAERKRAEEALRASEEQYRAFFNTPAVGAAELASDGRFSDVNDCFREITGYTREELLHMTPADLTHPDDRYDEDERLTAYLRGRIPDYQAEKRYVRKDGRVVWVQVNAAMLRDASGEALRSGGIIQDITARKQAEESLRESQALLRAVMENTTDPIYVKDRESRILMCNPALERVVGKPASEIVGKTDSEYSGDPGAGQALREHDLRVMASGQSKTMEETVPTPDGHRTFLSNKTPYRDAADNIIGIFGISHDITERKTIEQALRQSEERYRRLIQYAPAGIYEIDFITGRFTEVNDAMCQILGYTRDELLAMTAFNILDDEGRARFTSRIRLGQSGGRPNETAEYLVRAKDGRLIWGLLNVTFRWDSGKIVGATVVAHDITDRKRAEEALKRAHAELEKRVQERTVELSDAVERLRIENIQRKKIENTLRESEAQVRFFASQCLTAQETERKRIAGELHDSIAASLAATKFGIEKIADEMRQGNGTPESLEELASRVSAINNDVRRIMADLRPSVLDDLGIVAAINWFCREYQKTYSHIRVEKQIEISEQDLPDFLKTPIFRISQEAMNNIAKHSQASHVNCSLRKEENRIRLTIQDNGQGFDLETTRRGLGLTTMSERAQLSGGTFELESAIGKGTILRASWTI